MKIPNLAEIMVSLTDFKKQLSDIINNKQTKVIIKNNEPTSIIMPYKDYVDIHNSVDEYQNAIRNTGESIILNNGVEMKVLVELSEDNSTIITKTFYKMKTSGEFVLHFTHHLSAPSEDLTLTNEEIYARFEERMKKQGKE